jgi:hypothetical protein
MVVAVAVDAAVGVGDVAVEAMCLLQLTSP